MTNFVERLSIHVIFMIPAAVVFLAGVNTPGVGPLVWPVTGGVLAVSQFIAGFISSDVD